jgi:hypothetical protein
MTFELQRLSTDITSYAVATNATWPFVTLPHFDLHTRVSESQLGAEMVIFSPIVKIDDKIAWEAYSMNQENWIAQDLVSTCNDRCVPYAGNIQIKTLSLTIVAFSLISC